MTEDPARPLCPPPDDEVSAPAFPMPTGATDCHAHVFGPESRYPYQENRAYTPRDLPIGRLRTLHSKMGVDRLVLVQASAHGTDNRAILDAIATEPAKIRGVCALTRDTTDAELESLNDAGFRGMRLNMVDKGGMPFDSLSDVAGFSNRIADLGWHIELHVETAIEDLRELAKAVSVPISVGHFGYTKIAAGGVGHPGYREFLSMLADGHFWVKLTAPYRISASDTTDYSDIDGIARSVVEAAPDRVIWGSDWPHILHFRDMPNDGDMLNAIAQWAPDEELRRRILVENPATLYDF